MRILLATGFSNIEKELQGILTSRGDECWRCYHRQAVVPAAEEYSAEVVVLSPALEGSSDLVETVILPLRQKGIRVIFLPGGVDMPDTREWLKRLVPYGIYCYVFDPVSPQKVIQRIEKPGSLGDIPVAIRESAREVSVNISAPLDEAFEEAGFMLEREKSRKRREDVRSVFSLFGKAGVEPEEAAVEGMAVQGVSGESRRDSKGFTRLAHIVLRFLGRSRTGEAGVKPRNAICDSEDRFEKVQFRPGNEEPGRKEVYEESRENIWGEGRHERPSTMGSKEDVPDAFYRDALTGCFTRRYLLERFSPTGFYTVVFIDLDNFKPINDILGHGAGDGVLAAFGKMLVENLKGRDLAVRWGGDEFLLVLPGTARADAEKVVENLRREWKHCAPDTGNLEVGFSAGIVEGARNLQATIKEADRLMYAEKRSRKVKEAWEKSHPRELYTPLSTRPARVDWATLKQAVSLAFSITAVVILVSAVVWGMDWTAQMFGAHAPVLHEAARVVEEFWKTVLAGVL
ncbi:diguanylate cyclase (GGDEF) domain-containing protein [Desulfofundulus australicus DSM 11792]|uniref:Diguanylate cyclase (GGDEF) domain-containing protein n=1 Tax=Desulfofundulus australicus DSM 11792 TaxID=1121425 RepID=A0A1M4XXH6_9FIRM|nr:GGDEF domain-containing protein [Desulfofundulus australicus]SHE98138.1 diguanylate cyclase (GGDEF) domain-containing protein [Desulfofundulus australicus DSM 11792]